MLMFAGPRRVEVVPVEDADRRSDGADAARPAPGQVRVRALVSAISAGTELLAFRGELPPETALDETLGALAGGTFAYPFRYGYAAVGEVVATGPGVGADWLGRRVFGFVPHATAFTANPADLVPVPDALSTERAALLAHMETAVNLVLDGAPLLGEQVLVIGGGTVGLLATALLARFPLAGLTVCERLSLRRRAARALGAGRVVAAPGDAIAAVGAGGALGADLSFELSGDPAALDLAIAASAHEGRIVVGSWYGSKRAPVDLGGRFHRRRLRLVSSQVSHLAAALSARWDRARRFAVAWKALADIDTSPFVSHRFPFVEAQAAYDLIDRHPEQVLQVLFQYE